MLRAFAALVVLSLADAVLTVAEAAHVGMPAAAIEANPVARLALHYGLAGLLAFKVLPLGVLGVLLIYRPVPRIVRALVLVFGVLMVYHGMLFASWS